MGNNLKFFYGNLIDNKASFAFTSASTDLSSYLYDNDKRTKLQSVGSNDATPEVWTITFAASTTFDSLHISNHNIKSGTLKYWNGSTYVDFSTPISWSGNAAVANYYHFNSVSTTKIQLTMNTTMVVNAEKYVGQIATMVLMGEVVNNPSQFDPDFPEDAIVHSTAKGGIVYVLNGYKFYASITFQASDADMTLLRTVKDQWLPFFIYPCGGSTSYAQEGMRVQDIYLGCWVNSFKPSLPKNRIVGAYTEIVMEFREV
mgnify:CR=1 FL=1